jgi:DNA repair protein RecN (Recombination protein N)
MAHADDIDTLIFDEVDTGISGRAARKVGIKLRQTGEARQILCVTHLAQIASQAHHHLLISKSVRDGRTYTDVLPLDEEGQVQELARIIGGEVTDMTCAAAREMLQKQGELPQE